MVLLDSQKLGRLTTVGVHSKAGIRSPHVPSDIFSDAVRLLPDAGGIAVILFCSSMVTAKSFAIRTLRGGARIENLWVGVAILRPVLKTVCARRDRSRTEINDSDTRGGSFRSQLAETTVPVSMDLM